MNFLRKTIPVIFIVIFLYVLTILFLFEGIDYTPKKIYILPNIGSLLLISICFILVYCYHSKKEITNKKYFVVLGSISIIAYTLQLIMQKYSTCNIRWDAGVINRNVKYFFYSNEILSPTYFTRYPNNIFILFIQVIIKKIPFIGNLDSVILIANALLVNLSGVFTSLTVRNLTQNNKTSLLVYLISTPLILLSPWILVAYTDTFAILFPIIVLYIYTKPQKKYLHYFFIVFLSFLGYYIKPTVIIILIAITIVEIFDKFHRLFQKNKSNIKKIMLTFLMIALGIIIPIQIQTIAKNYLNFSPSKNTVEFNWLHFLAMGQNNETYGVYSQDDVIDSIEQGTKQNIDKFIDRITNRSLKDHIEFVTKKTLINFNDSGFSWDGEGSNYLIKSKNPTKLSNIIESIIYDTGKYYEYFLLIIQWIWLLVLFFCLFIPKTTNTKNELVIMLTLIGITLFLTIFEARNRYLYCYSPIFVVGCIIGIKNLKMFIKSKQLKKQQS